MSNQSMTDIAFDIISQSKEPLVFKEIWSRVSAITGAPINKMSNFYTNMSLDSRFVALPEMKFELRSRMKFEDSFVDTSALDIDDEELEDDEESETEYGESEDEVKEEEEY